MENGTSKRILSTLLAGVLALTSMTVPTFAAVDGTVAGEPVTTQVAGEALSARENDFNDGWRFYLGTSNTAHQKDFNDSGWKQVDLPHDFSISQSFTTSGEAESGFLPGGTGWYRKSFILPAADGGKRVLLDFDGVYSDAYVYVNGTLAGENHYGYNTFAIDLTDYVTCDGTTENVVAVKAVNTVPSSRWYSGSGIYRDVTLIVTDPVCVDWNGTRVTTPDIATGRGTVSVAADIVNGSGEAKEIVVTNTVYEKDGTAALAEASVTETVAAGRTATVTSAPVVAAPKLWSTTSPTLYTVVTTVTVDGTVVDSATTDFGFRYFSFDRSTGFSLNGEKLKLNGVCMHHDQGALGAAAYHDAMYRQLTKLKDMGVNAIRTSHDPAARDFIDLCNELGILVVEEIFDGWSNAKNGNSNDFSRYFKVSLSASNGIYGGSSSMTWAEFVLRNAVKRDRNDPSVIMWSLGNEILEGCTGGGSDYPSIAQSLVDWMKDEDTTRPATIGDNRAKDGDSTYIQVCNVIANNDGVVGLNYCSGSQLSSLYNGHSNWKIYSAETSSATNSRGIYSSQANNSNADGKYHLTSYDTSAVGWGMTAHDSLYNTMTKDYVAGEFVWTGFDYIGEPTPWNGVGSGSVSGSGAYPNSSYFGIIDTAGFEKDTYYLYRSQWARTEDTLHLVTAWDSDNQYTASGKTPVVIYSNAARVELYRNGTKIGTATRTVHATDAGHQYHTYSVQSIDSSVCTAVAGSGSSALYATFRVTYAAGTISAKAFDENGNEITTRCAGNTSVSTPGTVSRLAVHQDKTAIAADGSSLVYISVDVTDANGVLDTTATNQISFSLTGNGEIVGVDNGDQATTAKYQQSTVLKSATSASIAAYAGKALAIVRSTDEAGSFTVQVSASGLSSESVTVTTNEASAPAGDGLVSYTMVKDYTVKLGTVPTLLTEATGLMADGTGVTGTVQWDEIPAETYGTAGDHTIGGVLTIAEQELTVTCRLHVIEDVVALRNVAAVTTPGVVPTLPTVVRGLLADASLSGEFPVQWETMTAEKFQTVGEVVTVWGTAAIVGTTTLPVTASVRVAQAVNTESTNVAPQSTVTQDIAEGKQSDSLEAVTNGYTSFVDKTSERWSNWNNRTTSATAALTFTWATAHQLSGCHLYYYYDSCSAYPESIVFQYSLNGTDFTTIDATAELVQSETLGAKYAYTFAKPIDPIAVRIVFTQQDGTTGNHCVALIEAELMTYAGKVEVQTSADLSQILVDGTAVPGFAAETLTYTASGSTVTAAGAQNVGITVLPTVDGAVRIVTLSEDGAATRTYQVTLENGGAACTHETTAVEGAKAATCTEDGYTGNTVCGSCGAIVETGTVIPATGHKTELIGQKTATCTEEGYTGDAVCTVCHVRVTQGASVAKTPHSWNAGVVTTEPTTETEGVRTYTCTVCRATRTETIAKLPVTKKIPTCTLTVSRAASGTKIRLEGTFTGYESKDEYYTVVKRGFVYVQQNRLGTRNLTINFPGRTNVYFNRDIETFAYDMTPSNANTRYTVRAYLAYTDGNGRTVYTYSSPITASYRSLPTN